MWFVFPQLDGLGSSAMSRRYAIRSAAEAEAYLSHDILGPRLLQCFQALMDVQGRSAQQVFGSPDHIKLRSCATLFAEVAPHHAVFARVLGKFFDGERCGKTIALMRGIDPPSAAGQGALPPEPPVDQATLRAYQSTEYHVLGNQGFILRIGHPSAELLAAHQRRQVVCSAFLTAFNPFSRPTAAAVNAARQVELLEELDRRSLVYLPALGQHPSSGWPGEDSVLVFGLDLEAAKVLAARFEQNALVWGGADAVPELVLLR